MITQANLAEHRQGHWLAALRYLVILTFAMFSVTATAAEVRIKDITVVDGIRTNQILGMGLVTGLPGTGSKSPVTREFALNFMQRFGMRIDPLVRANLQNDTRQKTDNLSVVTVTADLPTFAREGTKIDVIVSTFDDAKNLQGGTLIMTPLVGADGEVYAVASGPISLGGFSASGQGATVQKNHPTTGRIPNGATVERETLNEVGIGGQVRLLLRQRDYETARRIAEAINKEFPLAARAVDEGTVEVLTAFDMSTPDFLGHIGQIRVTPDFPAKVVINERTGTVIVGQHVRISNVLITHANLTVTTAESPQVSQPAPFSQGETETVPRTQIEVFEEAKPVTEIPETVTVGDLATALNALGVTPRDLSSIFQQLKESGALHADLEFK
ncbi:MAG: flagellar basal body P-ring protein FlgI [Planctomycetaceae bacterium]